jgi:DNA (cytosine-5)-methyltransferase 1
MGFPDDHVFYGGVDRRFDQVGEAAPPPLSKKMAEKIIEKMKEI